MCMPLLEHYNHINERVMILFSGATSKLRSLLKIGPESALRIRRRQFLVGGGVVLSISALAYGITTVLFDKGPAQSQEESPKPMSTNIATAPSHINMGEARWNNLDTSIKSLVKEVSEIKKTIYGEESNDSNIVELPGNKSKIDSVQVQDSVESTPVQKTDADATGDNNSQHDDPRLEEIQERLTFLETARNTQQQPSLNPLDVQNPSNGQEQDGRMIQKLSISLVSQSKNLKTVETTIPAGAFAKTILLSGLDASSAMNAASDPRPMLLRIIDHGTLPRRFQSDLKDCHCTAGAYGDLSSERVYARLEKLTCVERATGEIIETQVAGYVAGSDGKAGVRGVVASKDGQFLARSLVGGIFSGLSNVANPQNRRAQGSPFAGSGLPGTGAPMAGPSMAENFTSGMAGGATTALDRLSQYYIDRAEQLQPVIQIAAGQVVDIVFTEGTFIGSESIRSEIEKTRDDTQNHQSSNNERN